MIIQNDGFGNELRYLIIMRSVEPLVCLSETEAQRCCCPYGRELVGCHTPVMLFQSAYFSVMRRKRHLFFFFFFVVVAIVVFISVFFFFVFFLGGGGYLFFICLFFV